MHQVNNRTNTNDNERTNLLQNFNEMAVKTIASKTASSSQSIKTSTSNLTPNTENPYIHDSKVLFLIEFSAGALGGVISRTATAPIDRLRTIFQVKSVEMNRNELDLKKIWMFMLQEGKWKSLWRGNLVNVLKTAPENAIRMASYEKLKTLVKKNQFKENSIQEKLACGSAAGFLATIALYPLKTVKTIMNLGKSGEFRSIYDCIYQIYSKHGTRAFYRGLIANSIAIIPSAGIDLAMYETSKQIYSKSMNKSEPSVVEKLFLGTFSSTLGNFVVYPLFFARTRLQANCSPNETTLNVLLRVWRKDGVPGWYRGFFLHILKIGPAASISYVTFEAVNKMFSINSFNS